MYDALRTKLIVVWILLGAGLMLWVLENRPSGPLKEPHPGNATACANWSVKGVKERLIHKVEDDYAVVYVTDRWDQVDERQKETVGHFFALCKSPNEVTEIRRASDGSHLRTFVIDLDYRIQNGLPFKHLVPGQK